MQVDHHGLRVSWKDRFAVGNPLIDAQHRAFFDAVDAVMQAIEGGASLDAVLAFYGHFLADLTQHFHDEEAILAKIGYPDTLAHAAEHTALLTSVTAIETMLVTGEDKDDMNFIIRSLLSRLIEHLVTEDLRYRGWMRGRE